MHTLYHSAGLPGRNYVVRRESPVVELGAVASVAPVALSRMLNGPETPPASAAGPALRHMARELARPSRRGGSKPGATRLEHCAMLIVMHYFAGAPFKRLEVLHQGWGVPMPDANHRVH